MNLQPLKKDEAAAILCELLESNGRHVVCTMVGGERLFADLHLFQKEFSGTREEAAELDLYVPSNWQSTAYELFPIRLVFNTRDGQVHGAAHVVEMNLDVVADISTLHWDSATLSGQSFKNIPNPLATLVASNNLRIIKQYDLSYGQLLELALSTSAISKEGINFADDEIIYFDLEFFEHLPAPTYSVGAGLTGITVHRSIQNIAKAKLKDSVVDKIEKPLQVQGAINECRVSGFLKIPTDQLTTEIEGYECIVVCCLPQRSTQQFLPVLIKTKSITYPFEFYPYIVSELVFYGELKQIPLIVDGTKTSRAMLARAIGFIRS